MKLALIFIASIKYNMSNQRMCNGIVGYTGYTVMCSCDGDGDGDG